MSVVRRSDGLLPAEGFVDLLALAAEAPRPPEVTARIISARGGGRAARTLNSLMVLQDMGLLESTASGLRLKDGALPGADVYGGLRQAVLAHYCDLLSLAPLGSVFQQEPTSGDLQVDRILLPFRELGLPYLLAEFGLFLRTGERAWTVAPDAASAFLAVLAEINGRALRARPMTPAQLEVWLAARRAAGEVAEAFALAFERLRLGGHCLADQVRWISHEDIGAGFDILSFNDQRSLVLDRFIEVKGYEDERAFYWSADEIAAAQDKREQYWLYLVDRSRVWDPDYEPEMVSDPYTYFIEENPADWRSEPASFKFTEPKKVGL